MRRLSGFFCLLVLTACSTMLEGSTQEVTITTPGAEGARCKVVNSYFRYTINPPRTFMLERTSEPYRITCMAPGNRIKTIVIPAGYEDTAFLNASNGVIPGTAVDAASGALFAYPENIIVDFTNMKPRPMPLPDYQIMLQENPLIKGLEEFRPGVPALQRDENAPVYEMQPRDSDTYSDSFGTEEAPATPAPEAPAKPVGESFVGGTTNPPLPEK